MNTPLAERMRPNGLEHYVGQEHLTGPDGILKKLIQSGRIPSMIFWGPPGTGKTTLAHIISMTLKRPFYSLSAINSGVKDVRETIQKAKSQQFFGKPNPILFIDEIHRFSKSQQDSLLMAVEKGIVTLIGATTENPSFEVIPALLSRCQVYVLNPLSIEALKSIVNKAIKNDELLRTQNIEVTSYDALFQISGGDARKLLNALELCLEQKEAEDKIVIDDELVKSAVQNNLLRYDKSGDQHYDIISAFIKSIRGSDPNAAIYYLSRMLEAGEDIKFICRRMIISASEDIGLANPNALLLANACFQSVQVIGMPEASIPMAQTAIYLACSEKSNASYAALRKASAEVRNSLNVPIPLSLRNAPTNLSKKLGHGKDYKYAHSYEDNFAEMEFLPEGLKETNFFKPGNSLSEQRIREKLKKLWKSKYEF